MGVALFQYNFIDRHWAILAQRPQIAAPRPRTGNTELNKSRHGLCLYGAYTLGKEDRN